MAATVMIDIIHTHPEDDSEEDNMLVMARGLIDPESSCEHEMMIMGLFVEKLQEIQHEIVLEAARKFAEAGKPLSHKEEGTGETFH